MSAPNAPISVYIIAYNEAEKLGPALASVAWADEVVVVDSGSTDGTADVAAEHGARCVQVPFEGFGQLRNDAVAHCQHPWVFNLDADERCTPEAAAEMRTLANDPNALEAYNVPRRNYVLGRWIRYSGYYPDIRQPQFFRQGVIRYSEDEVHETAHVEGRVGKLNHDIHQVPFASIEEMIHKINRYSTLNAQKYLRWGRQGGLGRAWAHGLGAFFRCYLLKRGFLDGMPGCMIALSNGLSSFYKYMKLQELQQPHWRHPAAPSQTPTPH